ncbi:DUF6122 family protein [Microbulbifer sediminum]|uniref:DUF6122 family protein n=1 Tax=Microbulbifer sediminum TaxID=2904250 RepID=UPI001F2B6AFF|nr:DUF6122 family protein [Microbulbifer sediminum]
MYGFIHIALHVVVPIALAWLLFRDDWLKAALIMLAANLVDLDHLFVPAASGPVQCAINSYPLHTMLPISLMGALLFLPWKSVRMLGVGLVTHMLIDGAGCGI